MKKIQRNEKLQNFYFPMQNIFLMPIHNLASA